MPKSYDIVELRCTAFNRGGNQFDMVRYEDFVQETHGFVAPHRHNYYMLLLTTAGTGRQLIDFKTYDVRAGQMYFMYPGMIHAWEASHQLKGYLIFFTADFFAQRYHYDSLLSFPYFGAGQTTPFIDLTRAESATIQQLMELMLSEYKQGGERMQSALRSLLNVVLIQTARIYEQLHDRSEETYSQQQILKQFEALIDKQFVQNRLVRDYASQLHITPNYLGMLCREYRGTSAGELIRERVMLEARRRLVHEDKTVAEIAYDLNFKDNAYFGRFFKRYQGITPEQFRKQIHPKKQ